MCGGELGGADGRLGMRRLLFAAIAAALLIAEAAWFMLGDAIGGWLPDGPIWTVVIVSVSVASIAILVLTVKPGRTG